MSVAGTTVERADAAIGPPCSPERSRPPADRFVAQLARSISYVLRYAPAGSTRGSAIKRTSDF